MFILMLRGCPNEDFSPRRKPSMMIRTGKDFAFLDPSMTLWIYVSRQGKEEKAKAFV